ncbi:hypothetical protein ATCV1_z180L [Acanthocystis turfacea chlorella virus 1]|uniref:Uncharacterized protein z180L n=1 Tax=Chlorovirus heliozoae TaxID=322019 RepID=A7K8E0_9PHYC|nr:hypothetical protein ATCV1_z180L [Acanthocystis turfacea chlorella virus 1]ABT16314.1 hypothetical protein ATCV1_z180L [Acanthocystis turfacea chlorella virus 1]
MLTSVRALTTSRKSCPTFPMTARSRLCRPPSSSRFAPTRLGLSALLDPSRNCSTVSSRFLATPLAAPCASGHAQSTAERRLYLSAALLRLASARTSTRALQ